jgi:Clp amino terminal domain, pathogenicity island component
LPERTDQQRKLGTPVSFKKRTKIFATSATLNLWHARCVLLSPPKLSRSVLAGAELIAELFSAADWNTPSAAIGPAAPSENKSVPPPPTDFSQPVSFSRPLEVALLRALAYANERYHGHATLEHLLLALMVDADAVDAMTACQVDLDELRGDLTGYIDNDLKALVVDDERDAQPTAAFHRVVQRALRSAIAQGRSIVTAADLLMAMFDETESRAVWLLGQHGMTRSTPRT